MKMSEVVVGNAGNREFSPRMVEISVICIMQ